MSFGWIFSILVGAVIIFFAIFATTQLIDTEKTSQDSQTGQEIGTILQSLGTGLEEGKTVDISLGQETRIYTECSKLSGETFGNQEISAATKSGVGKSWEAPGQVTRYRDQYLFSANPSEGKDFQVFVKPFEMPYKIGDLTFITGKEKYCFVNPSKEVEEDVESLNLKVNITEDVASCSSDSIKVCFTSSGCDIDVDINSKSVKKNRRAETVFYESDLLYGAVFSNKEDYECQVERLMARASEIALLEISKGSYLSAQGCQSNRVRSLLVNYANKTRNIEDSLDLREISFLSEEIRRENDKAQCRLF